MRSAERRSRMQPGERAPDFVLPAVDRDGTVSLADYRGKTPLLLAPMRGLYCTFCRRYIAQLGMTEILQVIASTYNEWARELEIPSTDMAEIKSIIGRREGFESVDADQQDLPRLGAQFTGQFMIDREGIVRWVNIEGAAEGLSGMEKLPTDEEFVAAARSLP